MLRGVVSGVGIRGLVSAAVIAGVLWIAPVASAAGGWVEQPAPSPASSAFTFLLGISCSAEDFCVAVGHWTLPGNGGTLGDAPLVEQWDGTAWSIVPSPTPPGALTAYVYGVSCTSSSACVAVGAYDTSASWSNPSIPFAERWDGSSWTLQSVPDPDPSLFADLVGISCSSERACTAVGAADAVSNGPHPLVERWDGTSWSVQPSPTSAIGALSSVSCPAASSCVAVGIDQSDVNSPAGLPLAETWDGTGWTVRSPAHQPGSPPPFTSVWCTTVGSCTGVASFADQGPSVAQHWDGSAWTLQDVVSSPTADSTQLVGVDCPMATSCIAIGRTHTAKDPGSLYNGTLAESWDGTSWVIEPTPEQTTKPSSETYGQLHAVSCPESGYCAAVGNSESGRALVEVRQNLGQVLPSTAAATEVSPASATLNGSLNREEWAISTCYFEWGTTQAYGNTAPCSFGSPGSGGPVPVHAALVGLSASTTYHYRLDAYNFDSFGGGTDQLFTTSATPSTTTTPTTPTTPVPPAGHTKTPARTLGHRTVGKHSGAFSAGVKRVNQYRLKRAGDLFELSIYLQPRSKHGTQALVGLVYSNRGGTPDGLLASTRKLVFSSSEHPGWYHLTFRHALKLRPGRYWLGVISGASGGVTGFRYDRRHHARAINDNGFTAGPAKRFGRYSIDDCLMSLYASLRA